MVLNVVPVTGCLQRTFDGSYVQYHEQLRPSFVTREKYCSHFSYRLFVVQLFAGMQEESLGSRSSQGGTVPHTQEEVRQYLGRNGH